MFNPKNLIIIMGNVIKAIANRVNNIFQYAAVNEAHMERMMRDMSGRERKTTFFSDLSIAEWCEGEKGVRETYANAMESWMGSLEFILEFALCLNWKGWQHYEDGNKEMCKVYSELWEKARDAIYDHYKEDEKATSQIWEYFD